MTQTEIHLKKKQKKILIGKATSDDLKWDFTDNQTHPKNIRPEREFLLMYNQKLAF